MTVHSRHTTIREMTLQVEIKTNYCFGILVLGVLQVAAARGGNGRKKRLDAGSK